MRACPSANGHYKRTSHSILSTNIAPRQQCMKELLNMKVRGGVCRLLCGLSSAQPTLAAALGVTGDEKRPEANSGV